MAESKTMSTGRGFGNGFNLDVVEHAVHSISIRRGFLENQGTQNTVGGELEIIVAPCG